VAVLVVVGAIDVVVLATTGAAGVKVDVAVAVVTAGATVLAGAEVLVVVAAGL
jgi:hypothetical protein